jgi:uncharacterized membrane protein
MDLSLFSSAGVEMLFAWIHFLAGVMWIGLLYYFNVVQVPFMAEAPAEAKPGVTTKLVPRALWWFRWGAMFTVLSGLSILVYRGVVGGSAVFTSSWGVGILLGGTLGIIMFLNVWLIIWPNQKIVIASANAVAGGGQADPKAADAAARAFCASRTNFLFSIPMLFFMGNHRITFFSGDPKMSPHAVLGICVALVVALEVVFAIVGKKGQGPAKILDKHVAVIHVGLALALVLYFLMDGLL